MSWAGVVPTGTQDGPAAGGRQRPGVPPRAAAVVGVLGACGGAGTSTLAVLTAARLARRTSTVLVDLDPAGGGVDVTVGLEDVDGARWPDLVGARGDVAGHDVLALLPRWGACAVLSADRDGAALDAALVADVLHALSGTVGAMVLDLPRGGVLPGQVIPAPVRATAADDGAGVASSAWPGSTAGTLLGACDLVVVAGRRDLRSVAGTLAVRPRLAASGASVGLVVTGGGAGGMSSGELAAAVDLPVIWSGRRQRRLARSAEHGVLPRRGPAASAARAVAAQVASLAAWDGR